MIRGTDEEVAEVLQEGFDLAILLRQLVEASAEAEESMKSAFDPAKARHGGAGARAAVAVEHAAYNYFFNNKTRYQSKR